jgi:acetyl-CoA acetyltransferase
MPVHANGQQRASAGALTEDDMSLRDKGVISGVGETAYSRNSGQSVVALQMQAALAAIADAGLTPKDIDGIIPYGTSGVVAEDFVTNFGIADLRFSATTPMGGASCVAAVQCAVAAISAGICRHVLIPLGRNGASESRIGTRVRQSPQFRMVGEFEMPIGALASARLLKYQTGPLAPSPRRP